MTAACFTVPHAWSTGAQITSPSLLLFIYYRCPALRSVISDIEVDYESLEGRAKLCVPSVRRTSASETVFEEVEFGVLYTFKYPLAEVFEGRNHVEIATTRPETILGDTALAVHPDDSRYKQLIGKEAINPLTGRIRCKIELWPVISV